MCPIDETNLPRPRDITIEHLRSLLADLPADWRLCVDDRVQLLLLDGDDEPRGYISLADQQLVLLDSLNGRDTGSSSALVP